MKSLIELKSGESGIVQEISDVEIAIKLIELGCIPGELITISKIAPLGCPIAIQLGSDELSLRKEEAITILVEPI